MPFSAGFSTTAAVVVAFLMGGIEALGLIGEQFGLSDPLWSGIGVLNDNFNQVGFLIIGVFIAPWIGSLLLYRYRGLDDIRVSRGRG